MSKRLVVIGGGPGGYVAAIRAAQAGAEVHLIECDKVGGTCLNVGCIPTKALLRTAHSYQEMRNGAVPGLVVDGARVDWSALQKHKCAVVERLCRGVEGLLAANRVTIHRGRATVQDRSKVRVLGSDPATLEADVIVVATGSVPVKLRFPGSELPGVIDSTAALCLPKIPSALIVVGGGVIGTEFAALYSSLGTRVTVVEMLPRILAPVDGQIAAVVRDELSKQGVEFVTDARLTEIGQRQDQLVATVLVDGREMRLTGEYVLVAVGRRAQTANLGLESVGVRLERGAIAVDGNYSTNVPGIHAIGDCNGQTMLAHAASAQGVAAVEHALGQGSHYNRKAVPYCVYTNPEVAGVGLTEEAAKVWGVACKIGLFPLVANGKSIIEGCETGLVKVLADDRSGEILGAHIVGPRATDLIGEMTLAMNLEASVDEVIATIHAHPTVSESLLEAALAVKGMTVHWPPGAAVPA